MTPTNQPRTDAPVPVDVLFGEAVYHAPELTPDGDRLLRLGLLDGVPNVFMSAVDSPRDEVAVTADRGRGVRAYGMCFDGRTLYHVRDRDGDESWQLHLLDLDTGVERSVTPPGAQARVLAHRWTDPATMIVGLNIDRPDRHDAYRLDLASGELSKVATNPGYLSWLIDPDLRIRGGTMLRPDAGATIHLDGAHWLEVAHEDVMGTRIAGWDRTGRVAYLLSSIDANASRLYAVDLDTGRRQVLAEHPTHDVTSVELDRTTGAPLAALVTAERVERVFLDDDHATEVGRVHALLAAEGVDGEVHLDRSDRTGRHWVVTAVTGDRPVLYYLYDRIGCGLRFLASHQPELDSYRLARMEPFTCRARDGEELHGYVSWPPGRERRGLPMVLNVHGGPWARNRFGYDEEAQLLASRGYACVQVNFRGSTGYGKRWRALGAKQWGAAMHTDLLDTVAHLVDLGLVDPGRVAVMGCSYGGYAALTAAATNPEVFRCAISLSGPSNLLTLLAADAPHRAPLRSFMHANIGDPDTEADLLWQRSPLANVDAITVPVLVAQGANDVRVPRSESEQIVAALGKRGVPCEYLLFPDEGHRLTRPDNRAAYYRAVEAFLARHLG